jgi:DNA-binding MarR family transcriptional regulator
MSKRDDDWADQLHEAFLDLVGLFNRPEPDAVMLREAGIDLDRALFPLFSRIGVKAPISVVELGKISGKDHSTVSRQTAKLEALGLVERRPSPTDQRVSYLVPSRKGEALLETLRQARRRAIQRWAKGWSRAEREQFLATLQTIVRGGMEVTEREGG